VSLPLAGVDVDVNVSHRQSVLVLVCSLFCHSSPTFPSAVVHRVAQDDTISVLVHNASAGVFVEKATVNGVAIDLQNHPFVDHSDLVKTGGCVLEYWMTAEEPTYN